MDFKNKDKCKVIIAGSRDIDKMSILLKAIELVENKTGIYGITIGEVVSGTAEGVDRLGERYAKRVGIPVKRFPANWDKYGKKAGMIRNKEMALYADFLIAICKNRSNGTMNMVRTMQKLNKPWYCYHIK